MKQILNLDGKEVIIDFKTLKEGQVIGDWQYMGNTTQPGNPLWSEFQNLKTGESTLKEVTPRNIIKTEDCNHQYRYIDRMGNVQCDHCADGRKLVTGYHRLENGKIISMIPAKRSTL